MSLKAKLRDAAVFLSGRCDGARERDGAGFSAADTRVGKTLALLPVELWTVEIMEEAAGILRRYAGQLEAGGFKLGPILETSEPRHPEAVRRVADYLFVRWDGREEMIAESASPPPHSVLVALRACPGRRWDPAESVWRIPLSPRGWSVLSELAERDERVHLVGKLPPPPLPDPDEIPPGCFRVDLEGKTAIFRSDHFPGWDVLGLVKALPGKRAVKTPEGAWEWHVPINRTSAQEIDRLLGRSAFLEGDGIRGALDDALDGRKAAEALEASRAVSSDFQVVGLVPGREPFPYQRAGVEYLSRAKRAILADEMGVGKTLQSIATMAHGGCYPAIIVCPASLKLNWQREIRHWIGKDSVILSGTSPDFAAIQDADIVIVNYEILWAWRRALYRRAWECLIVDEAHKVKSAKAKRTRVLGHLSKTMREATDPTILLLTGTPVVNMPADLLSLLRMIGRLDDLGGWHGFTGRYCVRGEWGGFLRGGRNLEELNQEMRAVCYIRRTKADVLTELPDKAWREIAVELDQTGRDTYQRELAKLRTWAAKQIGEPDSAAEVLAKIAAARQALARAKLPVALEWIQTFLEESGRKLVVFAHHRAVTEELARELNAPAVIGGVSLEDRQAAVDRFQTDPECRVIVCSISAAGVGLTLTAASDVLFVESGWTPAEMDQASDRCHRIGQKSAVTAWTMVATGLKGGTVDEWIRDLVTEKRDTVDKATEGPAAAMMRHLLEEEGIEERIGTAINAELENELGFGAGRFR